MNDRVTRASTDQPTGLTKVYGIVRLQEVVGDATRDERFSRAWCGVELEERVRELFVDLHDGGLVAAAVAVVWRAEDRYDVAVLAPIVSCVHVSKMKKRDAKGRDEERQTGASRQPKGEEEKKEEEEPERTLHDQLVRPRNEREPIVMVECLRNILPERITRPAWRYSPPTPIVRVTPQQIAHRPLVRDLLYTIDTSHMVQRIDTRRQSTVKTEDLVIDERGERKVVEEVGKVAPDVGVAVFAQTFVVEAIDLGDLTTFMIAAKDTNAVAVA